MAAVNQDILYPEIAREEVQRPIIQPRLLRNRRRNNNQEQERAREEPNPPQQLGAIEEPVTHLRLLQDAAWEKYFEKLPRNLVVEQIGYYQSYLLNVEYAGRKLDKEAAERKRQRLEEDPEAPEEPLEDMQNRVAGALENLFEEFLDFQERPQQPLSEGKQFENELWFRYFERIARDHGDRRPWLFSYQALGFYVPDIGERINRISELRRNQRALMNPGAPEEPQEEVERRINVEIDRIFEPLRTEEELRRMERERQQGPVEPFAVNNGEPSEGPGPIRSRRGNNNRGRARAREEPNPVRRKERGQN